ncbi:MAG TPA: glycoside hydrolase N-terminal domain-containing protein [Chloroflexota bacterium]
MSGFAFPGGLTSVDYASFLSRHDLVYLAPVPDGVDGLPLGNGDLGAMVWTPPDHLRLQVNKVDLWDDGPPGPFTSWGEEDEEVSTMLRSAATLAIGHGLPVFDRLYLTDFEARLRLAEAAVELRSETPFARAAAELFASQAAGVLVVRYRDATEEALPRRLELARWGTRSLLHGFSRVKRDVPLSLTGTAAGADGTHLWIEQPLRALRFAVAARLDGPAAPRVLHRRAAAFESAPTTAFEGTLYLAVVTSEEAPDPLAAAIEKVDAAADRGADELAAEHRRAWSRFWEASFVDLPPEQEYAENLWYLSSYYLASGSRGRYPLVQTNGIWSWTRDVRPWAHYYHWNTQPLFWPLYAAGHAELVLPYHRWRRAMLEQATADARRVHGREGAFFSDVANRAGDQATERGLSHNLTPGPQIAADVWRHYRFTGDGAFLEEQAYPLIREVARFYLATAERREDGRYTFVGTQPYESAVYLRDTLTDLAHARQLFGIFLEASALLGRDADLRERCREVLEGLADYVTLPVSTERRVAPDSLMDMRPILFDEVRPGEPTVPMWHVGYKVPGAWAAQADALPNGVAVHEGMADPATHLWVFTSSTAAPIFPSDQVGLDQAGTPDFEVALNTVRALGYDHQGISLWIVAKARLGLAEELRASLEAWPQSFQISAQGFTHWALPNHPHRDHDRVLDPRYLREVAVVGSPGERSHWPMAVGAYTALEPLPILQLAVNEMLLQSYSGTIRVFPAVTSDWAGRFRLHALGRFVVGAARSDGEVEYVLVESAGGEPCRIASPWPGRRVVLYRREAGWSPERDTADEQLSFPTQPGGLYLLLPEGRAPDSLALARLAGEPNREPKVLGAARLGMPKGF